MKISLTLFYQYMAIFINFSHTSSHLHPLQVENCGSNSRLVVDEDDNSKFRLERVKLIYLPYYCLSMLTVTSLSYSLFLAVRVHLPFRPE